ncbi:RNA-directed DNA polymerase [Brevundimonas sp.]|uniref:RNA-directed DNA polymerase n=1 Tax=Brevundimonas sp. TaxID=1871086 RepID=UPI003F701796
MKDRWGLIQRGLFPETVPPCFTSVDLKRAFSGLVRDLKSKEFHQKRHTDYIRYNGTKHDHTRRYFGTPNPISYFYVASFIADNWEIFNERFESSPFSVSSPRIGRDTDDRPIVIPSLSELTSIASQKLGHSAFILKTDISQFFPSIYTHSIAWSAHGIDHAKADQAVTSKEMYFNKLDFFVRNCQLAETRGVLVGPDAFRLISEFIASGLDSEFNEGIKSYVIGAARHVDDYYIGIGSQPEALSALSTLRDTLQRFNLQINDAKTRTMDGTEPLNEIWAQRMRKQSRELRQQYHAPSEDILLFINEAMSLSKSIGSDSPVKIALRTFDQTRLYQKASWALIEPYLLRAIFHHPHCIDYAALLVAKRVATGGEIDRDSWKSACHDLISRHLPLNNHHEIVWLMWLMISCDIDLDHAVVDKLSANGNSHISAIIVYAYTKGSIKRRPPISLGAKLSTTDDNWLLNLVAKSSGYSKASFSGALSSEFDHLVAKKVRMIDFKAHMDSVKNHGTRAISLTRYGYDSDNDGPDLSEGFDWGDDDDDPLG